MNCSKVIEGLLCVAVGKNNFAYGGFGGFWLKMKRGESIIKNDNDFRCISGFSNNASHSIGVGINCCIIRFIMRSTTLGANLYWDAK
jgi:hypothetical protein